MIDKIFLRSKKMRFWKMEAAGNDFVIFDGRNQKIREINELAKKLCDRHFGIGADGILFCESSSIADVKMNYYNSDGSRGEMCGNGIRCLSRYVYENKIVGKTTMTIETDNGIKEIVLTVDEKNQVSSVQVQMGKAEWEKEFQEERVEIEGKEFVFYRVTVGVPHIAILVEDFMKDEELNYWGSRLEKHSLFPKKTNVNFVKLLNTKEVQIKTWERGAGRTLGCATGCSSCGVILQRLQKISGEAHFYTEGGDVFVEVKDDVVMIYGKANFIFAGDIDV